MPRDDFPANVIDTLSKRAAFICSNPNCRIRTIGPDSSGSSTTSVGVAAHICAAAPGGPRFDPRQTTEGRKSLANAIWLCNNCSRAVDNDPQRYPVAVLLQWRTAHERSLARESNPIVPPQVSIETASCVFALPENGNVVTADDCKRFRDHRVRIGGDRYASFERIKMRIQLPELVTLAWITRRPAGREVLTYPHPTSFGASLDSMGTVEFVGNPSASNSYYIETESVRAGDHFEVIMRTVQSTRVANLIAEHASDALVAYIEGTAEFTREGEAVEIGFLVPLVYDKDRRLVRSMPMVPDEMPVKRRRLLVWGDQNVKS